MNFEVITEPIVVSDLLEIANYYSSINSKLANDFLDEFEKIELIISNIPRGFESKYKNVRTIKLERFPYLVHYVLNENTFEAIILAVTHTSRKPSDFTKR